ncbi:MAG: hypothetical protein ACM3SO_03795 [Betaproteobacteria bacterium]
MRRLLRSGLLFALFGAIMYAAVYVAADRLVYRTGQSNPLYKIATAAAREYDWVILGASHAMTLDFAAFAGEIERASGQRVVNLAAQGTGPLYQRFVLEEFARSHRARRVLYVVDSFAFYSRRWNEERFGDAKLLRRTPFSPRVALHLLQYVRHEGVEPTALLDYVSGFSKVNDRDRFARDAWEGEAQFERVYRTSSSAVAKRIQYLYPDGLTPALRERYLGELAQLLDFARSQGMEAVVVKMPLPDAFRRKLPDEDVFDEALAAMLAPRGIGLRDFSQAIGEPKFYFDSDHLNRGGLALFLERDLAPVLSGTVSPQASAR